MFKIKHSGDIALIYKDNLELLDATDLFEDEDIVVIKSTFKNNTDKSIIKSIDLGIKNSDDEIIEICNMKKTVISSGKKQKAIDNSI